MKPLKTRISITIDDPIYQRIKGLAEYDDRSVSSYINLALREHLERLDGLVRSAFAAGWRAAMGSDLKELMDEDG